MYYRQPTQSQSYLNPSSIRQDDSVIRVTGESILSVPADKAQITLGVITENKNLSNAQSENTQIMTNVIDSLVSIGIPKDKIETIDYRIVSEYDYIDGKQVFRTYRVTHQIQVTVDNIGMSGMVVDTAVDHGANSVSSIRFIVDDSEYYQQALAMAIENGYNKATTIAQVTGVTLNHVPSNIVEVLQSPQPVPYTASFLAKTEATPIQSGEIKIRSVVRMTYSFQS